MKIFLLALVALFAVSGVYYLYDRAFVFKFVLEDGPFNTNYTPLGLPIILFVFAGLSLYAYLKTAESANALQA